MVKNEMQAQNERTKTRTKWQIAVSINGSHR